MNLAAITGGCRRTFIALISVVGLFVFGALQDVDVSSTVASITIALAAANGAEKVFREKEQKKAADK